MSPITLLRFAAWAALAGAFIPVMAALHARLGRADGASRCTPCDACSRLVLLTMPMP